MSSKRFRELKNLSSGEIATKLRELEAELFQARMKSVTGQLSNRSSVWKMKKDVARMKTLQTQQKVRNSEGSKS